MSTFDPRTYTSADDEDDEDYCDESIDDDNYWCVDSLWLSAIFSLVYLDYYSCYGCCNINDDDDEDGDDDDDKLDSFFLWLDSSVLVYISDPSSKLSL